VRFPPRRRRRGRRRTTPEDGPREEAGAEDRESGERRLYARALARLARREYGRRELASRLARTGAPAAAIASVLDRLEQEGWLNEERFVRERLRILLGRGYGPLRLRVELERAGLDRATIETRLRALGGEALAAARALCLRRLGPDWTEDPARVARARALLARRGFASETLRRLLRGEDGEGAFEGQ
jgi:regulatory protein